MKQSNEKAIIAIIPTKGIKQSKQTIRKALGNQKTNQIVNLFLHNCLDICNNCKKIRKNILLSPKPQNFNHYFKKDLLSKTLIKKDQAATLNDSLKQLFLEIAKKKHDNYAHILVIMPDIPMLTPLLLNNFIKRMTEKEITILPLPKQGTGILALPESYLTKINPVFGINSYSLFKKQIKNLDASLKNFRGSKQIFDIDNIEALRKWINSSNNRSKKEQQLKAKIKAIL